MVNEVIEMKTWLCPGPRDFFRHKNIPKKPEKEKAGVKCSSFFGLLLEYSSNGCVPAVPFSASSSKIKYITGREKSNPNQMKKSLTSVAARFMITTITRSQCLKNKNKQESSHE